MAQPTSSLTYQELIRKIAKKAGVAYHGENGDKAAMVPIDAYNLEYCKGIAEDGIRMFISDAPKRGWKWQKRKLSVTLTATRITGTADAADSDSLTDSTLEDTYDSDDDLNGYYIYILTGTGAGSFAQIEDYTASGGVIDIVGDAWLDQYGNTPPVDDTTANDPAADSTYAITGVETVGGDIARYPLPEYFGGEAAGNIDYAADTNYGGDIEWCDESFIRANRSVTVSSGYPRYAAIRSLEPALTDVEDGSAKRRYELIVDPQPSGAYVLEFPYMLSFDNLQLEAGKATNGAAAAVSNSALANLYPDDFYIGWRIDIIAGTGVNDTAIITDCVGADGEFFVDDWLYSDGTAGAANPAANSAYMLYPLNNHLPPGFRFDEAVLAACYAKLAMEDEDQDTSPVQYYIQKALPKAYEADARLAPRKLGSMNTLRGSLDRVERTWDNVTTDWDV